MSSDPEIELTVESIRDGIVVFNLWYYRLDSIKNVNATLDGNIASFSHISNDIIIKGTLVFEESSITVDITESEHEYVPVETMIFDSHDKDSKEYDEGLNDFDDIIKSIKDNYYSIQNNLSGFYLIEERGVYKRYDDSMEL